MERAMPGTATVDIIKQELKIEIDAIKSILLIAQENLGIVAYLYREDANTYKNFIKYRNVYWHFQKAMSWRLVVLELYKLFSRNEDYSFRKLLLSLRPDNKLGGIIEEALLNKWEIILDDNGELIGKLRNQRNKIIAHQDREGLDETANGISILEIRTLIALAQEVVKSIYFEVTGSSLIIDNLINSPVDELDKIITLQAKEITDSSAPYLEEAKKYKLEE